MGDAALAGPAVDHGLGDVEGSGEACGIEEVGASGLDRRIGVGGLRERRRDPAEDVAPAVEDEAVKLANDGGVGRDASGGPTGVAGQEGGGFGGGEDGVRREAAAHPDFRRGGSRAELERRGVEGQRSRQGAHASTVWAPSTCTERKSSQLLAGRSHSRIALADILRPCLRYKTTCKAFAQFLRAADAMFWTKSLASEAKERKWTDPHGDSDRKRS